MGQLPAGTVTQLPAETVTQQQQVLGPYGIAFYQSAVRLRLGSLGDGWEWAINLLLTALLGVVLNAFAAGCQWRGRVLRQRTP